MRRSATLGTVLLMFVAVLAAPASAHPQNTGGTFEELGTPISCGDDTILRDISGWYGMPEHVEHVSKYHLSTLYTNNDGRTWRYMNTGLIRWFVDDGDSYVSLSGRSENVGPDNTTWIGRWVRNLDTEEVSRVGQGLGALDEAACTRLTD